MRFRRWARTPRDAPSQNLLQIDQDDRVNAFIRVKNLTDEEYNQTHNLIFATKKGIIKKTSLAAYSHPRAIGVNAIIIREDDEVISVRLTNGNSEVIIADRGGQGDPVPGGESKEYGQNVHRCACHDSCR